MTVSGTTWIPQRNTKEGAPYLTINQALFVCSTINMVWVAAVNPQHNPNPPKTTNTPTPPTPPLQLLPAGRDIARHQT